MKRRVFYVASLVVDPRYRHLESAAARNKVLGVCAAIRAGGGIPVVVTAAGTSTVSWRRPLHVTRRDGVCFVEVWNIGGGVARRLSSLFSLVLFACALVRTSDRVLLYNAAPEHLLLALWLRLRGPRALIDIEDAPRGDDAGALGKVSALAFGPIRRLCAPRAVVASVALAEQLGIRERLPVYGVSSFFGTDAATAPAFLEAEVRIMFGGTILHDTGADLFAAALHALADLPLAGPVHVFVTGRFSPGLFDSLAHRLQDHPAIRLSILTDLDTADYAALVRTMDAGLCLKLPSSQMGRTTFPSKVIEITALGMLLVSTSVSDVPLLFDDDTAILLRTETPEELARAIADIVADTRAAAARARRGQERAHDRFNAQRIGPVLMDFLIGPGR